MRPPRAPHSLADVRSNVHVCKALAQVICTSQIDALPALAVAGRAAAEAALLACQRCRPLPPVVVDQMLHALRGAAVHLVAALHKAGVHLRPRACSC